MQKCCQYLCHTPGMVVAAFRPKPGNSHETGLNQQTFCLPATVERQSGCLGGTQHWQRDHLEYGMMELENHYSWGAYNLFSSCISYLQAWFYCIIWPAKCALWLWTQPKEFYLVSIKEGVQSWHQIIVASSLKPKLLLKLFHFPLQHCHFFLQICVFTACLSVGF